MNLEAQKVVEFLRLGIPPEGHIRYFTVGRNSEIASLQEKLSNNIQGSLLIKANYGSGKSHLLKFIRESALAQRYLVSSVTLDSRSAVRFNRMEQIFGAILRGLEVPNKERDKGIRPFYDWLCQYNLQEQSKRTEFWQRVSNGHWGYTKYLESPNIFVTLRAWISGRSDRDLIESWLHQTGNYTSPHLRKELIGKIQHHFREPLDINRPLHWAHYTPETTVFNLKGDGYAQCWAGIRDIHKLAIATGLRGLVILFDEFEDVLYNLGNIRYKETAFQNLFRFFQAGHFNGHSFFAVTPGFVSECKRQLFSKNYLSYNYAQFDNLPTFEMSPLDKEQLIELSDKVCQIHGIAYSWETNTIQVTNEIKRVVDQASSTSLQDRTRYTICETVKALDNILESSILHE
jgi:hypothetical protein